jgi:excisionase family DNA binding protein
MSTQTEPEFIKTHEVATMFGVDVRTVRRWTTLNQVPSFRTPGGHRRYDKAVLEQIKRESTTPGRGRREEHAHG